MEGDGSGREVNATGGPEGRRFLFVCGLHRSGTTIVTNALREHPAISGFRDTGEREDEGQFLQSVYPVARVYGGPGKFAFDPQSHLTEDSPLATPENAGRMFEEWSRHWDLSRPVLMEKSPPNLTKARFLQALFPDSWFLVVTRHPVGVTYATFTRRPKRTRFLEVMEHWVHAHEVFEGDLPHLRRVLVLPFERFVADPDAALHGVHEFVGVEPVPNRLAIKRDTNEPYFAMWRELVAQRWKGRGARALADRLEPRARRFGYSFEDLDLVGPAPALAAAGRA
ncbi:MAG TPA: sulfotransferase [Acidimicrobiales bacterium]|jgi:GNAT superfamily N-acetyltransferase